MSYALVTRALDFVRHPMRGFCSGPRRYRRTIAFGPWVAALVVALGVANPAQAVTTTITAATPFTVPAGVFQIAVVVKAGGGGGSGGDGGNGTAGGTGRTVSATINVQKNQVFSGVIGAGGGGGAWCGRGSGCSFSPGGTGGTGASSGGLGGFGFGNSGANDNAGGGGGGGSTSLVRSGIRVIVAGGGGGAGAPQGGGSPGGSGYAGTTSSTATCTLGNGGGGGAQASGDIAGGGGGGGGAPGGLGGPLVNGGASGASGGGAGATCTNNTASYSGTTTFAYTGGAGGSAGFTFGYGGAGSAGSITVTYTVAAASSIQTAKAWSGPAPSTDTANIASTSEGNSAISTGGGSPASSTVASTFVGTTVTLPAETFTGTGVAGNYTTVLDCKANGGPTANTLSGTNGQNSNTLILGASDAAKTVLCTYTNAFKGASIQTAKAWTGTAPSTDTANIGATSGAIIQTGAISTGGGASATSTAGAAAVGATVVFPAETFSGTGVAANYTTSFACTGNANAPTSGGGNGQNSHNLIIAAADAGKTIVCKYTNTIKTVTLQLRKTWAAGSVGGNAINVATTGNIASASVSLTANSGGGNTTSGGAVTVNAGTSIVFPAENFTNGSPSNYTTTVSCVNSASTAVLSNAAPGSSYNPVASDGALVCTYTNTPATTSLQLVKSFGANVTGTTISVTSGSNDGRTGSTVGVTSNGSPSTTNGSTVTVSRGALITLPVETFSGTWTAANYTSTVSCNNNSGTLTNATLPASFTVSPTDPALSCTYSNVVKGALLRLDKTWTAGSKAGDAITVTSTGNIAATVTSTAAAAGNTTPGSPVTVAAGVAVNLPAETFNTGVQVNYTTTVKCVNTAGTVLLNNVPLPASFTPSATDGTDVCTYTNTRKTAVVTLNKTWVNAKLNDAVNVTATGLTTLASVANPASKTDNGPAQTVGAGDVIPIAEAFTTGAPANYTSALSCSGTSGLAGNVLTVGAADTNIACTFTNTATSTATVILQKTWRNGTDNNGTTSNTHIPAITAGMTTPTGAVDSFSAASVPSNNSTSSTPGTAAVGATLTLPVEALGAGAARFGVGAAAPVYSCTDGTTTLNNIVQGGTVTVPASSTGGTLTCTLTNAALTVVVLGKSAVAGSQSPTFNFTVSGATNPSVAFPFTPNNSPPVTSSSTQEHRGTVGTAVVITELSTPNWPSAPASAVCTDLNASNSGNSSSIPIVLNNGTATYTVPAANMVLGANIQCVFSNEQPQITLNKIFVGTARDSGNFTLRISGTNSQPGNADVTAPATFAGGGGGTPFAKINAGQTVTLSETAGAGTSLSNYAATISCKDGNNLAYSTTAGVAGSWTLTAPSGFISGNSEFIRCDITNTAPTTLQLNKTWAANSTAGDQITVTTTGGSGNPTVSSTATAATTPTTTTGIPATVTVGNTITLPAETFIPASSAANYTAALACTGGGTLTGNTLVINAADNGKPIVCTYTNTLKPLSTFQLRLRKVFAGNISPNDAITATTTGGTLSGSPSNPTLTADALGGSTPTTGASVLVTQGNIIKLLAENFTTGSQVNYTTTVSCNNNASPVTNATPPVSFTVSSLEPSITCTYTNTPVTNPSVRGRVFNDNGAGSGTPNDGVLNGSEAGLAGVNVRLTNCAATVYAQMLTNGSGNFILSVPSIITAGMPLCVEETNLGSSVSTGASVGSTALPSGSAVTVGGTSYAYTRTGTPDRIAFTFNGTGHAGLNFGDVGLNTFAADDAKAGKAGTTVVYAHTFTAQTGGVVNFSVLSSVATPTLSGWNEKVFADAGCTGTLQPGATVLYPPAAPITVIAGQQVCIIVQEFIPATAQNGYINTVKVQASFGFTNAGPALSASYLVTDITKVGVTALDLKKEVRNLTQSGVFGVNNQAKSGETLEYRITYTNNAPAPVSTLAINDTTPAYASFVSAQAGSTPGSLTACAKTTPANPLPAATVTCSIVQAVGGTGPVDWNFTGSLAPGGTGTVLFQVKVN